MSEHEQPNRSASDAHKGEQRPPAAFSPTGGQPLILYDLATLVGAAYQQRITVTRQQRVAKRLVDLLRPRLHGQPRPDQQRVDTYVEMLVNMAVRLGLLSSATPWGEDEQHAFYRPAEAAGLELWSQWHAHKQARAMLAEWRTSTVWQDLWSADFELWDSWDWNPLAARGLLLDLLSSGFYEPEQWYLVSALLEEIWSRGYYFLRPTRQQERTRTQDIPSAWRTYWDRCERLVYVGILASTLSELGIVSLASSPTDFTTGPIAEPTRWKLTNFGAQVFSIEQQPAPSGNARRLLVVQPSFEVILLEFNPRILYQLLPFVETVHIEQASRLRVTRTSVLRGIEHRVTVEQMLAILQAHTQQAVPQNVVRTMHDWAKSHRGAKLTDVIQVEVTSEALADELCASPQWRAYSLEKIAPCRLLAHQVYNPGEFRWQVKQAGIMLYE